MTAIGYKRISAMAKRGAPARLEITNQFVLWLMERTGSDSLTDLSRNTGIAVDTLRSWAFERHSPETSLELVYNLINATGESVEDLLKRIKTAKMIA